MRVKLITAGVLLGLIASVSVLAPTTGAVSASYFLPAPAGTTLYVTQGNGQGDHNATNGSQYAWDFAVAGSAEFPVVAARGGKVIGLRSDSTNATCRDISCWTDVNYVLVDHGDGTSALYLHLATGSLKVGLGVTVARTLLNSAGRVANI